MAESFGRWKPPFTVAHCGPGTGKSQILSGGAICAVVHDDPRLAEMMAFRLNTPVLEEREAFEREWAKRYPDTEGRDWMAAKAAAKAMWDAARSTLSHGDAGRAREAAGEIANTIMDTLRRDLGAANPPADRSGLSEAIAAIIAQHISPVPGLTEAVAEVIAAARDMPRKTTRAGGTETLSPVEIPAHVIWRLDRALTELDRLTSPRADRTGEGI